MRNLWTHIRHLVNSGRYVIGIHASERLDERGILEWQMVEAIDAAIVVSTRPRELPNPVVEVEICLPDGTPAKVVWSWIRSIDVAKLVTMHYFD